MMESREASVSHKTPTVHQLPMENLLFTLKSNLNRATQNGARTAWKIVAVNVNDTGELFAPFTERPISSLDSNAAKLEG